MPIRHRTLIAAAALLAAFSSVLIAGRSAARADYVYTFEGLTLTSGTTALGIAAPPPPPPVLDGAEDFSAMSLDAAQTDNFIEPPAPNLRGQDGWSSWTHTIGGIPYFQDTTVRSGIGINTTTVVGNPVNATNGNTDALTSSNASGILYRRNDANWSFTPFAGTETNATMQFDLTLPSAPFFPGGNGVKFGLGRYTSDDITVAGDQWGPVFGIENLNGGQRFYVRAAGVEKTVSHADPTAGAEYTSSFLANTVGSAGDWFQLQLVMDFTANSGSGAGTL